MYQEQQQVEQQQQQQCNNEFDNMIYNNFEDFDNIIDDPMNHESMDEDEQNYNYIVQNLQPQPNFLDYLNPDYSNISDYDCINSPTESFNNNNNISSTTNTSSISPMALENTGEFYGDAPIETTSGCLVYSINDFAHSQLHNYINNSYQDNQISATDNSYNMTYAQHLQQQQQQLTDTSSYGVGHLNANVLEAHNSLPFHYNNNNYNENVFISNNNNFITTDTIYNNENLYINNNNNNLTIATTTTADTFYNKNFDTYNSQIYSNNNIFSQNYDILKNKIDDEEIFKLIKDCEDSIELSNLVEECEENANIFNVVLNSLQEDNNNIDDFMMDLNKTTDLLKADAIKDILKEFPSIPDNEIINENNNNNNTEIDHLLLGSDDDYNSDTTDSAITNYHDIMNEFDDLSNGTYFDEEEITPTINPLVDVQSYLTAIDMVSAFDAAKDDLLEAIAANDVTDDMQQEEETRIIITPVSTNSLLIKQRNRKILSIYDRRSDFNRDEYSDDSDGSDNDEAVPEISEIVSPIPVLNLPPTNDDVLDHPSRLLAPGSKNMNSIVISDDEDDANNSSNALRQKILEDQCREKLKRSYYKTVEDVLDEEDNCSSSSGSSMSKKARLGQYDYVSSPGSCMEMPPNSPTPTNDDFLQLFPDTNDSDFDSDDECDEKKIKIDHDDVKSNILKFNDSDETFYKVKNISNGYMSDDVTIKSSARRGTRSDVTVYHHKLYNIKHKIPDKCNVSKMLNFFMCSQKTKITNKKTYPPYLYSISLFGGRRITTKDATRVERRIQTKAPKTGIIYSFENDIKFKFDFKIRRKNAGNLSQYFFNNDNKYEFTIKKSDEFNFNYVYFNAPLRKYMKFGRDNQVSYRGVRISRGAGEDDCNRPILARGAIFHYMQDCESSVQSKNQSCMLKYIHNRMLTHK